MPETNSSDKKPPLHERVGRKFSFLNTVAFILLLIAAIVSFFK